MKLGRYCTAAILSSLRDPALAHGSFTCHRGYRFMSRVPGCGWMTVFRRFPNRYSRNSAKRSQNMRLHTCEPMPGFSCHFRLLQLAAAHLCVNVSLTVLSVKSSTLLLATPHLFSEVASPEARDVGRARLRPGLLGITCVPPRVVPSIRSPRAFRNASPSPEPCQSPTVGLGSAL